MDTNQEQRRQRRDSSSGSGQANVQADVFDTHGNDLIKAHVADARSGRGEEESSLLALAGLGAEQQAQSSLQQQEEELPQAALKPEADDHELTDDEIKARVEEEEAQGLDVLDDEEQDLLLDEIKDVQLTQGTAVMGGVAEQAILEQVQHDLDRADVLVARERGDVDELMQDALRNNALKSRDEVIYLLQRLMTSPRELDLVAALDRPGDKAIQLVEYLAEMIMEPEQLYALAAYDHADIKSRLIISDEAQNMDRYLTPMAQMMGGFSQILYQLVCDELALHPAPDTSKMEEKEATRARRDATRPIVFNVLNFLRLVRSSSV